MSTQNDRRADRVFKALNTYDCVTEPEGYIIDLLADLHHLLERWGKTNVEDLMDRYVRISHDHYASEKT